MSFGLLVSCLRNHLSLEAELLANRVTPGIHSEALQLRHAEIFDTIGDGGTNASKILAQRIVTVGLL